MTPALPLVGAVTTLPNEAFTSLTDNAKQLTHFKISLNFTSVLRMAPIHSFGLL